jgi:hypothetical protein
VGILANAGILLASVGILANYYTRMVLSDHLAVNV